MPLKASKPLNRRVAIVLALACMWLLSSIGWVISFHLSDWWFLDLHGYDLITIGQIGGFFLVWMAAQIPAASATGMIIALSDFAHPLRTVFWTMTSYELVLSIVRAFHWPWWGFHDLDQSIPVLCYLISVLLLIGTSIVFTWFSPRFHAFVQRYSAHWTRQ